MKKLFDDSSLSGWLYGLGSALIGGGANAAIAGIGGSLVDNHLAPGSTASLKLMGTMFITGGVLSAILYLKQSPLPQLLSKTTTTVTATVEKTTEVLPESK